MRGKAIVALLAAVVVAVAAVVIAVAMADHKSEQRQRADFRADVTHSAFAMAPGTNNPKIEKETKTTKKKVNGVTTTVTETKTTIEALVVAKGCTVELERKKDETRTVGRNGRTIEVYELDEAVGPGGREIEIDDAPMSPLVSDVEKYLSDRRSKFDYCLAA